jgi:LmbE family N-acetylglucosaminyl deacetylase
MGRARTWSWRWILGLATALLVSTLAAQAPPVRDAADLQLALDKLQVLGSVLYLAAHPDDENAALLAYFSRGRGLRTAYLSLNRGEGGQNRIGPEQGTALGAIRTQELRAGRRLDGAEQYFARTVDFGYCKTPERALAKWGHQEALADVVWIYRLFRPDVVVTRFFPTQTNTHGHHTASAILAVEAFKAAGDPARFPEQLAWVKPWQPTRLYWNHYLRPGDASAPAASGRLTLDAGQYEPLLGRSYAELGAESHSQHRTQAYGEVARRGPVPEVLELLAGSPARNDPFEGLDTSWKRVPGGMTVAPFLARARQEYRPERPAAVLPLLLKAKAAMDAMGADPWVQVKRAELLEAIRCAAGIWVEALADRQTLVPGQPVGVTATILARNAAGVALTGLDALGEHRGPSGLGVNQPVRTTFQFTLPADTPLSQPYWADPGPTPNLNPRGTPDQAGRAEGSPPLTVTFHLSAQGVAFDLAAPVRFRQRDPVLGERWQPLAVVPPVVVTFARPVQVFGDDTPRPVELTVAAAGAPAAGRLRFQPSPGWRVEPAELPFTLDRPGEERSLSVRLVPPAQPGLGSLGVQVETGGASRPARSLVRLDYPHIPLQTLLPLASVKLARTDLRLGGMAIGYVAGSGDGIPECLRPLGYHVDLLSDGDLASLDLRGYDAVVVGIRAFNTRPALAQLNQRLLDYVAAGGTEIVLYMVDQGLVTPELGPYPFRVSRTRVTDEASPMAVLAPDHPLLERPNRITQADFQGWVQERGTYFAEDWDARYQPVFATQDAGEQPAAGCLITARHGKGWFVYTGLSFFRQLPEGVPGAYRLFANLLALGGTDGKIAEPVPAPSGTSAPATP